MKKLLVSIMVFGGFLACGCAGKSVNLAPGPLFPKNVAVLPLDNRSNDINVPEVIRKGFKKLVENKGYAVKDIIATDNVLNELGVTDAGQLSAMNGTELAKALEVGGVFYGTLLEFNYVTLGVYYKRQVRVSFKLVDGLTGKVLWEEDKQIKNSEMSFNKDKIKEQVATKLVEKIFRVTMIGEVDEVLKKIVETLPQ